MKTLNPKKIRKQAKKTETLKQATVHAILSMRKWKFSHRFKFAWWLLFGRGEWKGVE